MTEPIPLELRDVKCFHCGVKLWEYVKRVDNGRLYKCLKCDSKLFLDDRFCGLEG